MVLPPGSLTLRLVGSNVANNLSSAKTLDPEIRLSKVDFPALVYPTIAIVANGMRCLFFRLVERRLETC